MYAGSSVCIFLISIFSVSYLRHGNVNILIGIAGILALVLAVSGLRRGIEGFKERNKNYITCKVGMACNELCSFISSNIYKGAILNDNRTI